MQVKFPRTFLRHDEQGGLLPLAAQSVLFLFPIGMASIKSWASGGYYALVLFSLLSLRRPPVHSGPRGRWLLVGIAFLVFASLLSFINVDDLTAGLKRLEKLSLLVLAVPLFIGLKRLATGIGALRGGILVAGPVMAAVALYSTQVLGMARAKGYYHPIIFGDLAMLVSVLGLCLVISGAVQGRLRWLCLFSSGSAFGAVLLSQTRGAWLAVPLVLLLFAGLYGRRLRPKSFMAGAALLVAVIAVSPMLFPDSIGRQIQLTRQSIDQFVDGSHRNTSLGQRFLMWGIAVDVWREHPVIGSGLGDFEHDAKRMMVEGKTDLSFAWMHAHSIYFEYLASTGLLGLLAMTLALFVLPFLEFFRLWRLTRRPIDEFAALGGMALISCFVAFGFSETWLTRSSFVASYAVLLVSFLASLHGVENIKDAVSSCSSTDKPIIEMES